MDNNYCKKQKTNIIMVDEKKATEYYNNAAENKDVIKEKANNKYKNLSEEQKAKRKYGKDRYKKMKEKAS